MLKRKPMKVWETEVSIVQIPARSAFTLSKDVAQVAAQLLGAFGKLGTKSLEADLGTIAPELGAALAGIEGAKLDRLLEGLLATSEAKINGAWLPLMGQIDDLFVGRIIDLYMCLIESVRLNYPDFFDRLAKGRGDQGQPASPPQP